MMRSMTAYGRARCEGGSYTVSVELRSVNSRYFDCTVRLPRTYVSLEEKIKSYLQSKVVSRAKLEVNISLERRDAASVRFTLDREYLKAYLDALRTLRDTYHLTDDISVMRVAENDAIFAPVKEEEDADAVWAALLPALTEAGQSYTAMREAEGARIAADLDEKLSHVASWTDEIEALSQASISGFRAKFESRLRALLADHSIELDDGRILTECAIYADKIAIDEELVRLRSHFAAFRSICAEPVPSGKKLDFLMQELNRETNTIGSKANHAGIATLVVNIKNELEKMREQIQNIE